MPCALPQTFATQSRVKSGRQVQLGEVLDEVWQPPGLRPLSSSCTSRFRDSGLLFSFMVTSCSCLLRLETIEVKVWRRPTLAQEPSDSGSKLASSSGVE